MKKCDFDREARALSLAFASLTTNNSERSSNNNDPTSLIHWVVEENIDPNHSGRSRIFLSHPPFLRPYFSGDSTESIKQNSNNVAAVDEDMEEDISVEIDEATQNESHQTLSNNPTQMMIEWIFNVCYSDTWSAPVLYFRVQRIDGATLTRSEVLRALNYSETTTTPTTTTTGDSWDFVSEEEHPITGVPSFFLHPCQTSSRLELLGEGLSDAQRCSKPGLMLLGWLSMVLPAVQCRISSEEFHWLRDKLT